MSEFVDKVSKRRTFAIISHPDAGKTTLTEKFLLYGGADGPTSIFLAGKLGQTKYMGPIAVAAYSYMSLVPIIQPPIMKLLTTKKESKLQC